MKLDNGLSVNKKKRIQKNMMIKLLLHPTTIIVPTGFECGKKGHIKPNFSQNQKQLEKYKIT